MSLLIDADSHVLEPADLWLRHLEPQYRDRAIRIEEVDGVEHLIMGDTVVLAGNLAGLGGGHLTPTEIFGGDLRYLDGAPPASYDPAARVALYDAEGVAAGVVFPTIGILPFPGDDVALKTACCRAYNRWQAEFAASAPGRILPIASLCFEDVEAADAELAWCLERGFRGVFLPPELVGGLKPGDPAFDRIWRRAAEAGVPLCLHVVVRFGGAGMPYEPWHHAGAGFLFGFGLNAPGQIMPALATMVLDGVFDRIPTLKVLCVEAGCGWAAHLMDRLDAKHEHLGSVAAQLARRPSEYLRDNVWYVAEPDERSIPAMLDLVGPDRILWGSDFPHIDSHPDAVARIRRTLAGLPPAAADAVLGGNAATLFGLA